MFHPGSQAYPTRPFGGDELRNFTRPRNVCHRTTPALSPRVTSSRTDRDVGGLEELNLLDAPRVPESLRLQIAALVADLPFDYSPLIGAAVPDGGDRSRFRPPGGDSPRDGRRPMKTISRRQVAGRLRRTLTTFLASTVEAIEMVVIVLGVGATRGWRSPSSSAPPPVLCCWP